MRIHERVKILLLQDMCDHYWPKNTEPMYYGYLKVQVISETKYGDWIVSKFMLTMVSVYLNKNAFLNKKAVPNGKGPAIAMESGLRDSEST